MVTYAWYAIGMWALLVLGMLAALAVCVALATAGVTFLVYLRDKRRRPLTMDVVNQAMGQVVNDDSILEATAEYIPGWTCPVCKGNGYYMEAPDPDDPYAWPILRQCACKAWGKP